MKIFDAFNNPYKEWCLERLENELVEIEAERQDAELRNLDQRRLETIEDHRCMILSAMGVTVIYPSKEWDLPA